MADDKHESEGVPETVLFLIGLFAVLGVLWWMRGGLQQNTGEGPLIAPPPPLGDGQSYNPSDTAPADVGGQ